MRDNRLTNALIEAYNMGKNDEKKMFFMAWLDSVVNMDLWCGSERPPRKTLCQRRRGHGGSCCAVIYWEDEERLQK